VQRSLFLGLCLALTGVGCRQPADRPVETVEVTAFDLHRAFREDPAAARARFDGHDLRITGEVANAAPRFRGTTMNGEVTVPSQVMLKTELDSLPTDIKYVQVEDGFDVPDSLDQWVLDPRIRIGETVTVSCPRARIRWTDPGLYISGCSPAEE